MKTTSSLGTSFLDLLASSLIAVFIVFVTAPEEESDASKLSYATFELDPHQMGQTPLVACLVVRQEIACSDAATSSNVKWSSSPNKTSLTVSWYQQDGEKVRYWVALHSATPMLGGDDHASVSISSSEHAAREEILSAVGGFQVAGEI